MSTEHSIKIYSWEFFYGWCQIQTCFPSISVVPLKKFKTKNILTDGEKVHREDRREVGQNVQCILTTFGNTRGMQMLVNGFCPVVAAVVLEADRESSATDETPHGITQNQH